MGESAEVPVPAEIATEVSHVMDARDNRRAQAAYFYYKHVVVYDDVQDLVGLCALRVMAGKDTTYRQTGELQAETVSDALGRKEEYLLRLIPQDPSIGKVWVLASSIKRSSKVGSVVASAADGVPKVTGLGEDELGRMESAWDRLLSAGVETVATGLGWNKGS
jgi:hypothetical protein